MLPSPRSTQQSSDRVISERTDCELGHFDAAIEAAEEGLRLAESQNNTALVQTLQSDIVLFRSGSPLRDVP